MKGEFSLNLQKASCFGRFFAHKYSLGNVDLISADLPAPTQCEVPTLEHFLFRLAHVCRCLKKLTVIAEKATGPYEISARFLKECAAELAAPLTRLFSDGFRHELQPSQWKIVHVVSVYKKSIHSKSKNYSLVSVLFISKVIKSIANRQLTNHLERHHLFSTRQYGSHRGLGTADLRTALQHEWAHASDSVDCAHVLAVDIAEAFDRVSHTGVLYKEN